MYTVKFSKSVEKALKKIDPTMRARVREKVKYLENNPRSGPNIKTLQGYSNMFRYRIGPFRLIYEVVDKDLIVWILEADWRGNIY